MTDRAPAPDRTKALDLLRQIESELSDLRARLTHLSLTVENVTAIVEPILIAQDLGDRYLWPRTRPILGQQVRLMREELGLTRQQLATLTGVADSTLRNIETHRHQATRPVINRVVTVLERLTDAQKPRSTEEPEKR